MIIYFKVANYKSIKEEVTLNFNAASISEHVKSNIIDSGKFSLLKSMTLYGHNASGKSKLLDALVFMRWFINNSATEKQSFEEIKVEPFELSQSSSKKPSYFEICFLVGRQRFRYGFEVDKNNILKEWFLESKSTKEYPVFLRIGQSFDVDFKRFENSEELEKRTRKNALFLSVASQWNVQKAQKIDNWFSSIFTVHGLEDLSYRENTLELLKNEKYKLIINKFIQKADLGINTLEVVDIQVTLKDVIEKVPDHLKAKFKENFKEQSATTVLAFHDKYDDKGKIISKIPFLLDRSESEGTKKFFNLIGLFVKAILEGRLVIIDEFDARFHTLLSKAIIKIFNSEKIGSTAQLLIASHDTALLDRNLLRRDQIYFVEKNEYGATKAISLVEYKPRKDSPYDKNYLEGKYGGIPFIEDLESLFINE
ncbi:MAG: ATP-binding protein [Saprospiraceae bacterium]|nr:ATP-binding protein [Saprospiraceae bacterium]